MKTKILLGTFLALSSLACPVRAGAQGQEPSNLPDEYLKNLKNYQFVNTRGMHDLAPNRHSWVNAANEDRDEWEFPSDEEIRTLRELGINFPDFSFIQGIDTVAPGQRRQRTHTIEHILYALPGDALSLYPYYGLEESWIRFQNETKIESTKNFLETFSHWYDYRDGGRVQHQGSDGKTYDLLDFPSCRSFMQISDEHGFYGGIYMSPGAGATESGQKYSVGSPQEYIEAVNAINNAGGKGSIELTADLDFNGYGDVPMIGDTYEHRFSGTFNGNGHKISNLTISRYDGENVGLIGNADNGVKIYNLIIDSSCLFEGRISIGLVGKLDQGSITVKNVVMNATVRGTKDDVNEQFASAILGRAGHNGADNHLHFEDLYIGAQVGTAGKGVRYDTALCGWLFTDNTRTNSVFKNIVVNGTIHGPENLTRAKYLRRDIGSIQQDIMDESTNTVEEKHSGYSIIYTNCYGNVDNGDLCWKSFTDLPVIAGWTDTTNPGVLEIKTPSEANLGGELLANSGHRPWNDSDQDRRKAGTSAVFYFPDNGSIGAEFLNDRKEYVIAADFSQTFEPASHLNIDDMTITEPLVGFRHIFRIRDGREQARELKENNRDYVRRHQHKVTARVGANFQIRLDFPLPTGWGKSGGVTNYYYKKPDGSYDRVKQWGLRVLDGDTRQKKYDLGDGMVDNSGDRFELGADIRMRRATASSDKSHADAINDMFHYHTMLTKPAVPEEAHYIVQVIAKDDNGQIILSDDGDMVIMEYDITFLPEKGASLLTEKELYENNAFRHARDEYMKEEYGDPMDKIDFDDFFAINALEGNESLKKKMISYSVIDHLENPYKDFPVWSRYSDYQGPGNSPGTAGMYHSFYKWPISWNRSGYSFGYNYRYDYNMYMLTTHSENVPYHAKADEWTDNIDGENGLYDRLYYKTRRLNAADPRINIEQGYYYYVNAASDPGVTARLNFNIDCPGSRVIVSAWVAEMSPADAYQDEPANLSFNFVAVMKESGERIVLHNFITGYLGEKNIYTGALEKGDRLGKWLNVYYSFVPRLAEFYNDTMTFDDVDHFELELAHNGRSSAGSDYAIDDIRAYVVPPYSDAEHDGYACEDSPLDINIETSFETLLEKSGIPEAFDGETDEEIALYFAFVDKEMADEGANTEKAFVNTVSDGSDVLPYGMVKFSNNYRKNDRYPDTAESDNVVNNKAYRFSAESGDRMIRLRTTAAPGTLHLGKEYYVVFRSALSETDIPTENTLASFFDIAGDCSYNCAMIVRPSLMIKVDGVIQPEFDDIAVCENQSPVIQVNVWSTDKNPVEVVKNAYFDWFDGSINDFENYRFTDYPASMETTDNDSEQEGTKTLKHALEVFRFRYAEAEKTAGIKAETTKGDDGEMLEQWMLDIIDIASAPDASGKTRLLLHQTSFVLPPVNLPDNVSKTKAKVVAIPIVDLYPAGDYESVCPSPTEVGVGISNRTPIMLHGLTGITYPENLDDVPLRVGIGQLRKGDGHTLAFSKKQLDMPVRKTASTDGKEKAFYLVAENALIGGTEETRTGCLLLAQTNDPEYRDLGTVNDSNEETGHLLWIGEIKELQASSHNGTASSREYFIADFADDFHFKEGYYYRLRFAFEEEPDEKIDADARTVCKGHDIFTIKVVPEHMQWTGDKNLSWDNDDNWRRVAASEILKSDAPAANVLFTDGANPNTHGYAPLPFTKVVVDKPVVSEDDTEGETPWLYAPASTAKVTDDYTPTVNNNWSADPTCPSPSEEMSAVGNPTSLIQYDMTGFLSGNADAKLQCRPWTANSCAEIHFLPGATVMGQQNLNYEKAWVDVELDHSRWYLLSTPLKDIFAGDFYLPTANGRQETELFREISFDKSLNNRFAPAVYQRGWDKGTARLYEFGKEGARNAAIKTFWSHVYNDVAEAYGEGNAFSLKTDVSKVTKTEDKVLFRLPKADTEYLYYSADGSQTGHKTSLEKTSGHRLNETNGTLTSSTANTGRFFLVGNPFMTHFDIKRFLEINADRLEQRYWLITEQGQIAGSVSESGLLVALPYPFADAPSDPSVIAPMQGFFVEAKSDTSSLELVYDETMMRRYDSHGSVLAESTRAASTPTLRIISLNDGRPSSAAILVAGNGGGSADAFDFRDLGIASTVFTATGGHAKAINFCEEVEGMEIGVIADDETETTLVFEGTEMFEGLMLIDREEDTMTPLEEVDAIKVRGAVSGRFFLTAASEESIACDSLRWSLDGNILTVSDFSNTGELSIIVCDILGRVTSEAFSGIGSVSVTLDKGISVIRIANANEEKTIKLNI